MTPKTRHKAASRIAVSLMALSAIVLAGAALGNHGTQEQSICARSSTPTGTPVIQPITGPAEYCGQWICTAAANGDLFVPNSPCTNPKLPVNLTDGDALQVKLITVPTGDWTLTIYLWDLENLAEASMQFFDGLDATTPQEESGSHHWQVNNTALANDDTAEGTFQIWFGDPLPT